MWFTTRPASINFTSAARSPAESFDVSTRSTEPARNARSSAEVGKSQSFSVNGGVISVITSAASIFGLMNQLPTGKPGLKPVRGDSMLEP